MANKLVAFTHSSDLLTSEYIKDQLEAIKMSFPELETEQVNETDPRLVQYSWYPDRFPCFIMFENGLRKSVLHAKLHDHEAIDWVRLNLG